MLNANLQKKKKYIYKYINKQIQISIILNATLQKKKYIYKYINKQIQISIMLNANLQKKKNIYI